MDGFEGISIEYRAIELLEPTTGFKGISFESSQQQYFEGKSGFKSISIEYDIGGSAKKIWHLK